MKRFHTILIPLLCAVLVACGSGDDWRSSGVVVDKGTITHDGQSTRVLVTVTPESAAFYRNLSEQILFDSVSFPVQIPDAEESFAGISFDDLDGDGETDVVVQFAHADGSATTMTWLWDPVERYVFREDLSTVELPEGNDNILDFVGLWEFKDGNLWLKIHDDGTWEMVNDSDGVLDSGTATADGDTLTMRFDGSEDVTTLERSTDGGELVGRNGAYRAVEEIPRHDAETEAEPETERKTATDAETNATAANVALYVGLWEYTDENVWVKIHKDATWEILNENSDVIAYGTVSAADDSGVTLQDEDTVWQLFRAKNGDLLDSTNGSKLVSVQKITQKAYFEKNGLSMNALVDNGTYLLPNGFCTYEAGGSGFSTGDCYWEVSKTRDETHDGIREIAFEAYCYVPTTSVPLYTSAYSTAMGCALYDAYTGMWLTDSSTYSDSTHGESHYIHTVEWGGKSYQIEFFYATEWTYRTGDWDTIMKRDYIVYMPADYDGLVFSAEPAQKTYKDAIKHQVLDSICPEATILNIDMVDTANSLFFGLCD